MMRGTQVGTMGGTRRGVGIPMEQSSGWGKYVAIVVSPRSPWVVGCSGSPSKVPTVTNGGGTASGGTTTPPPVDVQRTARPLAERSLDAGQFSDRSPSGGRDLARRADQRPKRSRLKERVEPSDRRDGDGAAADAAA